MNRDMKQHITEKQWNELDQINKLKFLDKTNIEVIYGVGGDKLPNIGILIEFLRDDLCEMRSCNAGWEAILNARFEEGCYTVDKSTKKELCDALWEACKNKLKV